MNKVNSNMNKEITKRDENFAEWYTNVVLKTELCDYGAVKGSIIIRPYGYEIWEKISDILDAEIKKLGHKNVYFPTLFPKSYLAKEAKHIEGFAPEVFQITTENGEPLADPLVLRPTSEVVVCTAISKWVQSYKDFPVAINQWANIFRMEKNTRPFLRTSEFLWHEGYYFDASGEATHKHTKQALKMYVNFFKNILAIDVISGKKSESEKFAGAHTTYTVEAMMQDGRAIQAGTSHYLADGFSKSFDIQFTDKDGTLKYPHSNSFGVTTRLIGALIMVHGDDAGLVLPPKVAPTQIVIVPIAQHKEGVLEACEALKKRLQRAKLRVEIDKRDVTPGYKFNDSEMKGIPLRIELGPKDIENNACVFVRRVGRNANGHMNKETVSLTDVVKSAKTTLQEIHNYLYNNSKQLLAKNTVEVHNFNELEDALNNKKFAKVSWCLDPECESTIKAKTSATIRVLVNGNEAKHNCCVVCNKKAKTYAIVAKSY